MKPKRELAPVGAQLAEFNPEVEVALRESLRRCSSATIEAAVHFRKTGDIAQLPAVVLGIIERYVDPDLRSILQNHSVDAQLIEDLGVDSLTKMEIIILIEDTLQISISNQELATFATVADIKSFIGRKINQHNKPHVTPATSSAKSRQQRKNRVHKTDERRGH